MRASEQQRAAQTNIQGYYRYLPSDTQEYSLSDYHYYHILEAVLVVILRETYRLKTFYYCFLARLTARRAQK